MGEEVQAVTQSYELGTEIRTLSNLLRRKMVELDPPPELVDLTPVQRWLMSYLHENAGRDIFQLDVESAFCIRRSTVSRLLKSMEESGYICRQSVSSDGRLKKIVPTEKAKAVHSEVQRRIREAEADLAKGLTDREIRQFLAVSKKIKANLS